MNPVVQTTTDRKQLQQIIAGLTEGVILIEPDQSILWANDAALEMHGVASVGELGRDVTQYRERFQLRYRNNHLLDNGQYPIERVLSGERFTDVVVEVFAASDPSLSWVHRVRSLVLTDTAGEPDLLVLILHDASEWAGAERRFEKTFNANPAPALICRLEDQRYIKVNVGFLEMTGHPREALIGRTVSEFDVFAQAERHALAIERLDAGETIPQMEANLRMPDGGHKPVIVAGQPIEIGEEACMLFTFMDLEPRRKAESALRQSEQRFQQAFRMLPVPSAVLRASDLTILDVNEALCLATGYTASDIVGRHEDTPAFLLKDMRRVLGRHSAGGAKMRGADFRIVRKDGNIIDCLMSVENVSINQEDCLLVAWLDITDRKKLESELVNAIEVVMKDASWFNKSLSEKLANVKRAGAMAEASSFDSLSKREREVFYALCDGHSDKEIARRLDVALSTVRNHVATIYAKLDVHSRGAVLLWARDHGHLRPSGGSPVE